MTGTPNPPPGPLSSRATPVLSSFAILGGGQLAARALTFAATLWLTRALGVEPYGAVVYGLGVLVYALLLADFGIGHQAGLEVARDEAAAPEVAGAVLLLRASLAAAAAAVLAAFALLAPVPAGARDVTLLYAISILPAALHPGWAFVGSGRPRWVAATDVATEAVALIGLVALVAGPGDLLRVPLVHAAAQGAGAALGWIAFRRAWGRGPGRPSRALLGRLARASAPLAASGFFALLLYNFDVLALGAWVGTEATGLYGAAYRVVQLLSFLVLQYFLALRPAFGRASVEGYRSISGLVDRSIRITLGLAAGVAVGGALLAGPLLELLFGPEYAAATGALRWLVAATALLAVSRHHRSLLVAFDHAGADLRAMAGAAALNVGLNVALIPRFGLEGAAFATFIAEVAILAMVARAFARRVGPARVLAHVPRVLPAVAATAAAVWVSDPLPVLARVAIGGAVHLLVLRLAGAVTREDLRAAAVRRAEVAG